MQKLILNTNRLRIRNLKSSDLEDFVFYRSNPEVTKYQSFDVMTKQRAEQFIESQQDKLFGNPGEWVQFGIENIKTGKLIGDCAIQLYESDVRIAQVGITISHTQQGNGYAKETFLAIIDFLFSLEDFHRIEETVDTENDASVKLLENVGFVREGHFVENIFFNGKWGSEYRYALLKKNWKTASQKEI